MTLRVAHVLNSPGHGGVPRVAHALVKHSDPARFAPHVFYLKPGEGADLFADIDIPRRVATSSSKAGAMTELIAWLDAHRIDILHTHSFRPNLYARMAGAVLRPAGLKVVAHYHNEYADKWQGDALILEQRLAAVTDAAVAVSAPVASHVQDQTGLLPDVIENGVDIERVTGGDRGAGRAALGLSASSQVVGLVGRICNQKGVDTFVEAAFHLCPHLPDTRFIVIGDAEDQALARELSARTENAGLAERITFAGHRDQIADIYAALDLLVAPSRWEGFGLTLAEAMASGVPVVASRVGGIPDVVGQAGMLVPPDDPRALADAIAHTLTDRSCWQKQRTAGLRQAQRFDWAASSDRLAAIYDRLGAKG